LPSHCPGLGRNLLRRRGAQERGGARPDWNWTGHVDVNSAYYLRGITNTYGPNKWSEGAAPAYIAKGDAKTANSWGDAPEARKPVASGVSISPIAAASISATGLAADLFLQEGRRFL